MRNWICSTRQFPKVNDQQWNVFPQEELLEFHTLSDLMHINCKQKSTAREPNTLQISQLIEKPFF